MPYTPPSRWSYWASRLSYRTTGGAAPYVAGDVDPVTGQGGYFLDGGEHYDPELGYLNIQAHSDANSLGLDTSGQVDAAIHNYRDLAVRATSGVYLSGPSVGQPNEEGPGVPQWHVFLAGIAKHYLATGSTDAADEEAADILMSMSYYASDSAFREDKFHLGQQRELALALWAMCERHAMGLGTHPRTDTACELALGHLEMWSAPPETRRYGVWCKLFMSALTCRALTRYFELFGDSADATKMANCAAIPASLAAFADWVWTDGWVPVDDPEAFNGEPWLKGSIRYMVPARADAALDDITGLAVVAVGADPRRNFTGPPSLSSLDDHYAGAIFAVDGIADQFNIVAYDGATREITLGSYAPSRDITTSDTFEIRPNASPDLTEGSGPSPDLNHMLFPLYAWLYRHYTADAPDAGLAATARDRAHQVFDGAYQSWFDAPQQKQYNQSALWTTDGLGWLEEADTFDGAAPTGVLLIYSPAGGVLMYWKGTPPGETVHSVRDYGATGDGVTDDAAAIRAAVADNPGGVVFFPSGDYRVGSTIPVGASGTTLRGEGPGSILRLTDDATHDILGIPVAYSDPAGFDPALVLDGITIEGLTLDGNFVGDEGTVPFGLFVFQSSHLTVRRCWFRNWIADGITLSMGFLPSTDALIEGCLFTRVRRNAVHVGFADRYTLRRNRLEHCPGQWFGPSAGNGFDVEVEASISDPIPYARDGLIEENVLVLENNGVDAFTSVGVNVQPAYGYIDGLAIRDNLIVGYHHAVQATGALDIYGRAAGVTDLTIEGNILSIDPGFVSNAYPLSLRGVDTATVADNVANDPKAPNYSFGWLRLPDCRHVEIAGNTTRSHPLYLSAVALCSEGTTDVTATGNSYQTYQGVVLRDVDSTCSGLVASGNTDITSEPWDVAWPPAPTLDVEAGSTISAPVTVTVTAADDPANASAIARVYFFVDGFVAGISEAAPHEFAFDPSDHADGDHVLSAIAVDAAALASPEAEVTIATGDPAETTSLLLESGDGLDLEDGFALMTEDVA